MAEPLGPRILIHCDLDAFFAAVETIHHGFDETVPLILVRTPNKAADVELYQRAIMQPGPMGFALLCPYLKLGVVAQQLRLDPPSTSEEREGCTAEQVEK